MVRKGGGGRRRKKAILGKELKIRSGQAVVFTGFSDGIAQDNLVLQCPEGMTHTIVTFTCRECVGWRVTNVDVSGP